MFLIRKDKVLFILSRVHFLMEWTDYTRYLFNITTTVLQSELRELNQLWQENSMSCLHRKCMRNYDSIFLPKQIISFPDLKLPIFKVVSTIGKNMGLMNCSFFFKETSDLPSFKLLTGVHFHYNFIASLKPYVMSLEHAKNGWASMYLCMYLYYNEHQVSTLGDLRTRRRPI